MGLTAADRPAQPRIASSRLIRYPVFALALVAVPASILAEGSQRTALLANAALLVLLAWLFDLTGRRMSTRPFSLVRVFIILAMLRVAPVLVATLIDGNVGYLTTDGVFSYNDGAILVACARALLIFAMVQAALFVRSREAGTTWRGIADRFSNSILDIFAYVGFALMVIQLILLFTFDQIGTPTAYAGRVLVSYFSPALFFVGIGLRRKRFPAKAATLATMAVSLVFLLAGSRLAAVFSLGTLGLGYAAGKETPQRALWRWAAFAVPLLVVVGFLGEQLRSDDKGRTGQVALERVDKVLSALDSVDRSKLVKSTLLRLASTGEHSVITRVPEELPFEEYGVVRIPIDFASEFLPRFAFSGHSDDFKPRHWILNDLGFVVNWETSVELTLLADAWLRGGFLGVAVVGLLVGFLLQKFEDAIYRRTRQEAVWFAALVFAAAGLLSVEANGVASALRAEVFYCVAGIAVVVLARRPSWLQRPRRARLAA